MRTIAIGDIHGCINALDALLASICLPDYRLIFLGDYVDRGPDSRQVVARLMELSRNPHNIFLRGNHDEYLLRVRTNESWFQGWISEGVGGVQTLTSYGASSFEQSSLSVIPQEHFEFLESTRLFYQTDDHIFVHAYVSGEDPETNDPKDLLWRSFNDITAHPSGRRIVCGHTTQASGLPMDKGYAVCIDTLCNGSGWLSALDVYSGQVFQANRNGDTRQVWMGEPDTASLT